MGDNPGGYDPGQPPAGTTGSGSSTSSGPPADQYISDTFKQDAQARRKAATFASIYEQLWGEPATENYIVQQVNQGLNSYEFALNERQKPAWLMSKAFKDTLASRVSLFHSLGL